MRSLHVAALPFPTQQGTQAAVHAMLAALHEGGHETALLCYAHGGYTRATGYAVHRLQRSLGHSSLRSGPGLRKLALDVLLAQKLKALVALFKPEWVIAHHVEAALACVLARVPRFAFVAHTSLAEELRFYLPASLAGICDHGGAALDRFLCRSAARVFAISPLLAGGLARLSARRVHALRLPWPLSAVSGDEERRAARHAFGLNDDHEVVLYAGNLDAYQGLPVLVESMRMLARERPRLRLLVATQAPPSDLAPLLAPADRTRVVPLADEADRRRAHAAADVVAVPRASAGGLPIKLLDALARGGHVVATQRAAAGFSLSTACTLVADDDPNAFSQALRASLAKRSQGACAAARAYIAREHTSAAFLADLAAGLSG